jgi:hypothetical protein
MKRLLLVLVATLAFGVSVAYGRPAGTRAGHPHGQGHCKHDHGHGHAYGHANHPRPDCDDEGGNGSGNDGGGGPPGGGPPGGGPPGGGPPGGGNPGGGNPGGGGKPGGGNPGGTGGTGGAGGAAGQAGGQNVLGATTVDTTAPTFVAKPRLHPTRFRARQRRGPSIAVRTGTTITYTLSEAARVTFTVQKYRHLSRVCRRRLAIKSRHRTGTRCRRWISLRGRFAAVSAAGASSVRFTGRLRRRPLRPGYYRLVIRARDAAGNTTRPRRPVFRIVR